MSGTPTESNPEPRPSRSGAPAEGGGEGPRGPAGGSAALQAPWRIEYLENLGQKEKAAGGPTSGSFLRDYWLAGASGGAAGRAADVANHVVVRTRDTPEQTGGMILLNGFPYANGHLLVALGDARPTLLDYTPAQRAALWGLTDCAADLLQCTLDPQGINIGVNQGRAAGAGVPSHLHVHLVPRWGGDVNFISVVGNVRVIPSSLDVMAKRMRAAWEGVKARWGETSEG